MRLPSRTPEHRRGSCYVHEQQRGGVCSHSESPSSSGDTKCRIVLFPPTGLLHVGHLKWDPLCRFWSAYPQGQQYVHRSVAVWTRWRACLAGWALLVSVHRSRTLFCCRVPQLGLSRSNSAHRTFRIEDRDIVTVQIHSSWFTVQHTVPCRRGGCFCGGITSYGSKWQGCLLRSIDKSGSFVCCPDCILLGRTVPVTRSSFSVTGTARWCGRDWACSWTCCRQNDAHDL
mmetsp:Transcript_29106/g.67500  ORF Transcript_29106/g.67500 Transcript_29106/m.67500 type:complete len:229 (-) Transcript_29106:2296-2982(-)